MESRKNEAAEKKSSGKYNCAQAILCTYLENSDIEEETLRNLSHAFGAGMGNMEGTCGALVGAGMVLSMITKDKVESMKGMRRIMEKFQARNKVTQCRLLKGIGTDNPIVPCPKCVADAAEFLEEEIQKIQQ